MAEHLQGEIIPYGKPSPLANLRMFDLGGGDPIDKELLLCGILSGGGRNLWGGGGRKSHVKTGENSGVVHSLKHLRWTLSMFVMSLIYQGFHEGIP